jgi:predicted transcriptional regulator of viral defense system
MMALENNGTVTSTEVTNAGILRAHLQILVDKGLLEHVERGVYILPSVLEDEMFNLQTRYKRGIFSHETALFIHDLTDRTPITYSMTFPLGYNTSSLKKQNIHYFRVIEDRYPIGAICSKSSSGNLIRVYNPERTLCDILTTRSNTDIQVITDAFKRYTRSLQKDIPLLSEYAKLFRVDKKLQAYLDVLL